MLHWGGLGPLKSLWIYQPTQLTSVFSAGPGNLGISWRGSFCSLRHWWSIDAAGLETRRVGWWDGKEFFLSKKAGDGGTDFFFRKQGPCYLWNSGCTIRQCKVKAFRTAKCDSNFLENISSTGFIVETGINDSIVAFDAFLFGVIWQILPAMRYTTPWVPFFFVRNFNSMPLESLGWCFSVVFSFLADFLVGSKNSLTKGCETQHAAAGDTPQNKLYQQAI